MTTADQQTTTAAGVHGLLFGLTASSAGTVGVDIDENSFRNAYGGDYAARLRLVQLPACALSTPQLPRCRSQTALPTEIGAPLTGQTPVSAVAATVLAATAAAEGSAGDYTATSLSPGGSWSAGGNTGSFTYNYPIVVPPQIGGAAPTVQLSYDSSSQDARTVGTNNQSSWVGDGWSSTDNFIERTYRPCSEVDGSGAPERSGDLCWVGQILTLSLNGHSSAIVYDDDTHAYRLADDSSTTKIEKLSGAVNGTRNKEYFRVTEGGVQYYFGLNRLPGWSTDAKETNSAWTIPVYKAHDGVGDCPDGSFAATACTLGYRFGLDYVVDLNANAVAYYYEAEPGYYGANGADNAVPYTRGGYLTQIDYGITASTVYTATAPAQVVFTTDERCLRGVPAGNKCADDQFTDVHPEYWPDVPVDLNCLKDATNCTAHGPSFWTRRRLASITTQIQAGGGTKLVDRYTLTHAFPDGGDHAPTLWLDTITRTGVSRLGGAKQDIPTPAVTFYPDQMPNRVNPRTSPPMIHNRIKNIISDAGAKTTVDYSTPACPGLPADDASDAQAQRFASTNTTACMPVYWTPEGQPRPLLDWFYTYPVRRVTTIDEYNRYQDGSQPTLVTEHTYPKAPGWHYDDNEVVKKKYRTWGQFRGYPEVDVTTGDPAAFHLTDTRQVFDQKTLAKSFYFLGMNGDTLPGGETRNAPALVSQDGTVTVADHGAYAGQQFETLTYTGASGTVDSSTVTVPTIIGPTASRNRSGLPALTAQMVRTAKSFTRQKVSSGWRRTETDAFFNTALGQSTTGMTTQIADRGEAGATDNTTRCTFTRYLDGATATLVVPAEVITTDQDCTSAGAAPAGTLTSQLRTSYDGNPFARNGDGQANPARPTKGNPTLTQQASTATGATATAFVDTAKTSYDAYGRVKATTRTPLSTAADHSSLAQSTYTRYTPASGGVPVTVDQIVQATAGVDCAAVITSTKDCQVSSVTMEQARQLPVTKVDAAGAKTSLTYDAIGRLTAVWLPNKDMAAGAPANRVFEYRMATTGPNVVTSTNLLEASEPGAAPRYSVSKVLYDAMLRQLETQATGENGTTSVSDVQYDSHGRTVVTNNGYAVAGEPSDRLISDELSQVSVPSSTVTDYDAMGHVTQVTEQHNNRLAWRTRNAYTGDTTTTVPPAGGIVTALTVNARGQTTRIQQYTKPPTVSGTRDTGYTVSGGDSQDITYKYSPAGQQSSVTGPNGIVWTDQYDLRGRLTSHIDPDTGTSLTQYDDAGNAVATRDNRGIWLDSTYDLLGRRRTLTDRAQDGFKLADWTYDTLRIGKPGASNRYVPGVTGAYTVEVTGYSTLGNPLGQKITLPSIEKPLPLTYTTSYRYTPNTEMVAQQTDPAVAGLIGENIDYKRTALGAPTTTSGIELYVASTVYTNFGQPFQIKMGASTNQAEIGYTYDAHTQRLTDRKLSRSQGIGPLVDETSYTYDQTGNPLSVTNEQSETGNTITDNQCYRYDTLARLAQAWTAQTTCPAAETPEPTPATVSSRTGSYWQSFAYDTVGNRTELVDHATTANASDGTTGYTNGCTASCNPRVGTQPDTLTATSGGAQPTGFRYDVAGNMTTRTPTDGSAGQTLTWDDEGNLAKVTTTGTAPATTTYLYNADGEQLIRRDPGRTTLFTADTQIVVDTAVEPDTLLGAVRSYTHGDTGPAIAMRSTLPGGGTHYLFNDPHGTASLAMDTASQAISRQQSKPYGEPRSTANTATWPHPTRGYLGAPKDTHTGYTDLGARKYDPTLGRFISADPLLQTTDPSQLGGYTYAADNPITKADPNGLWAKDPDLDDNFGHPLPHTGTKVQHPITINAPTGNSNGWATPQPTPNPGGVAASAATPTPQPTPWGDSPTRQADWFGRAAEMCSNSLLVEMCAEADQRNLAEAASWLPYAGAPATAYLVQDDWEHGHPLSAGIGMISMLPLGKIIAKAAKGKKLKKSEQLAYNKHVGDAYRDHIADFFRQNGRIVVTDADNPKALTFYTPHGKRKLDMAVYDKKGGLLGYVETKSGKEGQVADQVPKDTYLRGNGMNIAYVYDDMENLIY